MLPTIKIVAINRIIIALLLEDLIRNPGRTRPRIMLYMATKVGRVARIVETRDIGPLDCAQNINPIATGAIISLQRSIVIVLPFCFISLSCLMVSGRIEISKEIPPIQNRLIVYTFQKER
jgi:hypothetical protein